MRIAVLFSKKDVETFSDTLNDETIVIGDISCKLRVREHLYPSLDIRLEKEVSALIREMFISFESKTGAESVKGFANNFYECAVAPIVAYVSTLSRVIKNLQSSGEEVEVWFPSRLLFSPKYSAYFLAEHESQGRRLYSRESVFLPYLEQVCKLHGVPVKYKMTRFGAVSYFQRIARVFAVFLWRLSHGIVSSIKKSVPPFQRLNSVDFFAISRTVGQTEFLIPFLDRTGLVTSLVAAESALGKGRNARLVHDLTAENSAFSGVLVETSIQYMLKKYLKAIFLIFRKPSMRLESSGIELNLDQAFTEVLVMWPELLAYRSAVHMALSGLRIPTSRILISTEQKSPHAQADAWVASQLGLLCVHVMQCDQHARPLPFPVFGDYFLADTLANSVAFAKAWEEDASKVKYIGSIKSCGNDVLEISKNIDKGKRWCFFSQVDNMEMNKAVLEYLCEQRSLGGFEFCVKLHPRDDVNNYRDFDYVTFIIDGTLRKKEFFKTFDYAITYPSGVVTDLLFGSKPFLLILADKWSSNFYSYTDSEYEGNVCGVSELKIVMARHEFLDVSFDLYRNRFFKRNQVVSNVEVMVEELLKLQLGNYTSNAKNRGI